MMKSIQKAMVTGMAVLAITGTVNAASSTSLSESSPTSPDLESAIFSKKRMEQLDAIQAEQEAWKKEYGRIGYYGSDPARRSRSRTISDDSTTVSENSEPQVVVPVNRHDLSRQQRLKSERSPGSRDECKPVTREERLKQNIAIQKIQQRSVDSKRRTNEILASYGISTPGQKTLPTLPVQEQKPQSHSPKSVSAPGTQTMEELMGEIKTASKSASRKKRQSKKRSGPKRTRAIKRTKHNSITTISEPKPQTPPICNDKTSLTEEDSLERLRNLRRSAVSDVARKDLDRIIKMREDARSSKRGVLSRSMAKSSRADHRSGRTISPSGQPNRYRRSRRAKIGPRDPRRQRF